MGKPVFLLNSLKTRLVLGSLAIFLISLWSLSFYVSHTLRRDMERLSKMTPKQLMALLMRGPRKQ